MNRLLFFHYNIKKYFVYKQLVILYDKLLEKAILHIT